MRKTFLAAALALAPLTAFAADPSDPLCDTLGSWAWIDDLQGTWTEHHMAGYTTLGKITMPIAVSQRQETINLRTEDLPPKLTFTGSDGVDLVLTPYTGPNWVWNSGGKNEPKISAEDMALVDGCSNDHLPRFEGSVSYNIEGNPMTLHYKMILNSKRAMFGIVDISSPLMNGKRWVTFTR